MLSKIGSSCDGIFHILLCSKWNWQQNREEKKTLCTCVALSVCLCINPSKLNHEILFWKVFRISLLRAFFCHSNCTRWIKMISSLALSLSLANSIHVFVEKMRKKKLPALPKTTQKSSSDDCSLFLECCFFCLVLPALRWCFCVSVSVSLSPFCPLTVLCEIDVWIDRLIELRRRN